MRRLLSWGWWCFFLAAGAPLPGRAAGHDATFHYVSYTGHDPAEDALPVTGDEYRNPILPGFQPDPSIVRVNDEYFLTNSSFAFFPGLPIYRSRDLVNWEQLGNAIDRPGQFNFAGLGVARAIFAPTLRWHSGVFYLIGTCVDCGGTFLIEAVDPAGPWSDPHWLPAVEGIDPDLFFDTDGTAWIVNNGPPRGPPAYPGHRALWLQEFDPASLTMRGDRSVIVDRGVDPARHPIWIEGPHLIQRDGEYFLIAAEGGTQSGHSEVVFRSARVWGPYVAAPDNPILTQRDLPPGRGLPITAAGHADWVETGDGRWWAVFLATRPYRDNWSNLGRETFLLPVDWHGEWPRILPPRTPVPRIVPRPQLPAGVAVDRSRWRDAFEAARLAPDWEMLRTPDRPWYRLAPGALSLEPRAVSISGRGNPSFLGKRQRHVDAVLETEMMYAPTHAGDCAGLVAFADERHHYFFGLCATPTGIELAVRRRNGAQQPAAGRRLVAMPGAGMAGLPLRLRISVRAAACEFTYALAGSPWRRLLMDADGSVLASEPTNQFTGALLGVYAVRHR